MDWSLTPTSGVVFDVIGVLGFALYVVNYALLTFNKITSQSHLYFWLNLAAASLVLVSLTQAFNLASVLIQLFWIALSLAAIVVRLRPVDHPAA
ncbi:CBU_0592 family membrane protein [Pseudooctadecabacter sp.]|uniref:CBU_0592 family membrane protein n=1 Tax=Pseudooctadecabacter sp. TaxID=1966338 RepID=UPI0025FF6D5F|nr:hypothetical protein [Pseudooctadecabacter sp.]